MTKLRSPFIAAVVATALAFSVSAQRKSSTLPGPGTETIFSTYYVKRGMEAKFAELNAKTWALYRKLDLALPTPHVVVRSVDSSNLPYFVEIFTWRSADIPDHAPPEVRAVWQELENACEKRNGRPGIDFTAVTTVATE
jgi:hypothetical protein